MTKRNIFFRNQKIKFPTARYILEGLSLLIVICLLLLKIAGSLTEQTLITFLIDIIPNALVLMLVVFFIDRMISNEKSLTLKQINKTQSEYIYLTVSRLSFNVLEYLGIINESNKNEYLKNDIEGVNKVIEKFKQISPLGLQKLYIEKIKLSMDKAKFSEGFVTLFSSVEKNCVDLLKDIYPVPHEQIIAFFKHDLSCYIGYLSAGVDIYKRSQSEASIKEMAKYSKKGRELLSLFITEINPANEIVIQLFEDVINISDLARKGEIFSVI
jgi:hypothetical protein